MASIKNYFLVIPFLCFTSFTFSQSTMTITTGPQWTDVMLVKSLKPSEAGNANNNYNSYARLISTAWTHSGYQITYRSLMRFDLTAIPQGTTIQSATLYLYADPAYTSGEYSNQSLTSSNSLYLQKITQDWTSTTVTWNNQPATTTSGRVWVPASTSATGNIQVNVTSLVQGMVNTPSTNYGIQMGLARIF